MSSVIVAVETSPSQQKRQAFKPLISTSFISTSELSPEISFIFLIFSDKSGIIGIFFKILCFI